MRIGDRNTYYKKDREDRKDKRDRREEKSSRLRHAILVEGVLVLLLSVALIRRSAAEEETAMDAATSYVDITDTAYSDTSFSDAASSDATSSDTNASGSDYIKWVDFTVSYDALCEAYAWDVETHGTEHPIHWIELLAYTAAKTGGEFDKKALNILGKTAEQLAAGETTMEELTGDMKYYAYYYDAYSAVLGGLVDEYEAEVEDENGKKSFQTRYGLKAYFPLAKGFDYSHYDDFGAGRSYGYKRRHLGHDMMGLVGTPVIAVESGTIEALGWNQYGGWRIGIRSFDKKRYYYYAHLRQNYPYAENLEEGSIVTAGDVIGYMGHTGYSTTENVNNIEVTHLHWGLQLIFDESQKESDNEIWIDVYPLTRFLAKHTQQVEKVEGTKEWVRTTDIHDSKVEEATKATQKERTP